MKDLLFNRKAVIGKVLASENLVVRYAKVKTASFNLKTRTLTMPIFKKDISAQILDTFVGHEVGHALWTPFDEKVLEDRKLKMYVNIVEDIRIERMIKSKFPGLVKSFHKGYSELWEDGFFGVGDSEVSGLGFADRINIHAKVGIPVDFTQEEQSFVDRSEKLASWSEVVEFAKELMEFCKKKGEDDAHEPSEGGERCEICEGEADGGGEAEGEVKGGRSGHSMDDSQSEAPRSDSDQSESTGGSNKEEDEQTDGSNKEEDEQTDDGSLSSKGSDSSTEEGEEDGEDSNGGSKGDEEPEDIVTQDAFDSMMEDLYDENSEAISYHEIAKVNIRDFIISKETVFDAFAKRHALLPQAPLFRREFQKFKKDTTPIVNHMLKEFEMKRAALQSKKSYISKSGDLDMNAIFKYRYEEDVFLKSLHTPDGKSHGLVMIVDWSGSMVERLKSTIQQVISLVLFCKKAGIDFEVYAFTDTFPGTYLQTQKDRNSCLDKDKILPSEVKFINFLSSKQRANVFNEALFHFYTSYSIRPAGYGLGGTPLYNTLLLAPELIKEFRKSSKAQVVHTVLLTDGYPGDHVQTASGKRLTYNTNVVMLDGAKMYDICSNGTTFQPLLEYAKSASNTHLLGFFLTNGSNSSIANMACAMYKEKDLNAYNRHFEDWKQGGTVVKNCGYDELYIVKSGGRNFNLDGEAYFKGGEDKDLSEATKNVKSALNKIGKSRNKKRIIMNSFIDIISKPKNLVN